MARPIIALLTDFGLAGPYVAAMKAVILSINRDVSFVDISHDVRPQAIEEGAFLLSNVVPVLPKGSICVAVVDPGVGTDRPALAVRTPLGMFVGPDNGLLSAALSDEERQESRWTGRPSPVQLRPGYQAVELANAAYQHLPVSHTFHGRDIFAPAAAHISRGVPLSEFGPPLGAIQAYPPWRAPASPDGSIQGRALTIDSFGNVVTDARGEDLPSGRIAVRLGDRELRGLQSSYQEGPEYVVYIGSSGFLEIGRRNGNAAKALSIKPGDPVTVRPVHD